MGVNRLNLFVTALIFTALLSGADLGAQGHAFRVHGSSGIVDISDLVNGYPPPVTESKIKLVCALITDRYHEKGYTAFYVERAVAGRDGTVDLYFNESVVESVNVKGLPGRIENIAPEIFIAGRPFNEFTLSENISSVKKKYSIGRLKVDIIRAESGGIVLDAAADGRGVLFKGGADIDPLYGFIPGIAFSAALGGYSAVIEASSSSRNRDICRSGGTVYLQPDAGSAGAGFNISSGYFDKRDYLDAGKSTYRRRYSDTSFGLFYGKGEAELKLDLAGTYNILERYQGSDGGMSFAGVQFYLRYDDSPKRIDYKDIFFCEFNLLYGWNFVENDRSLKFNTGLLLNIPMADRLFISLNGSCFYTSDDERFLQFYVFDGNFPCRGDDPSYTSFRGVAGADIVMEIFRGAVFFSSGIRRGYYNIEEGRSVTAPCFRALYRTKSVTAELVYMYDSSLSAGEGVLTFSVSALYL